MAALRGTLLAAAVCAAAAAPVPTRSLRGADSSAAEKRGGAGLDADADETCFTGDSHRSFYRNPWNKANRREGNRGDWVKCLPTPSFAVMCQHLYHPVRENEQGQKDKKWEDGPNQGALHDIEVGALYEQLHRVYSSTGHLVELKLSSATEEAVNHFVRGQGQFASSSTGKNDESWEKDPEEVVKLRQTYTNKCFSDLPGEGTDSRTNFRDSMYCALVRSAWLAPLKATRLQKEDTCVQLCEPLEGCSAWRPKPCAQTKSTNRDLKCFCRDGSELLLSDEKQASCADECGAVKGCGIAYEEAATGEACKNEDGQCYCKADRVKVSLQLDVSGATIAASDMAGSRLRSGRNEKKDFEDRGLVNDVGGWEVCDGTDHIVLENSNLCSDGTRALGSDHPCLVKLEGMSFAEAEPMCARKGGRLARADLLAEAGGDVSKLARKEAGREGLGVGFRFKVNTTLSRDMFKQMVGEGNLDRLGEFWLGGELTPRQDVPQGWNLPKARKTGKRFWRDLEEAAYDQQGAPSEACLLLLAGKRGNKRRQRRKGGKRGNGEAEMKAVSCEANADWLCEGVTENTKNTDHSVSNDLKADEGAFCMWHLPKAEVGNRLPNGQAGGFDNTELADGAQLPFPGVGVGWEGAKAKMDFLPASATRDQTAFHCHWSPTNTGLMRMYEFQHMFERGYPGAMKDRCACGYRHMRDLLKRCDCTRSGKQNGGCQKFHEGQLERATGKQVRCNDNQCDDRGGV